jgi:hypothetical protein
MQITQRSHKRGAIQRLAGNRGKSRLPEDGYLCHQGRGEKHKKDGDAQKYVHEEEFIVASAQRLYIQTCCSAQDLGRTLVYSK